MPRKPNQESASCQKCERPDSAEDMVGCDKCNAWQHFGCAGVADSIADTKRSWTCEKCREEALKDPASRISVYTSASSKKSRQAKLRLELLEQQNQLKMKKLEEEEKYLKEKFEILMQLEDDDDSVSERSNVSAHSKQKRLEKWLDEDVMVTATEAEVQFAPNARTVAFPTSETQSVSRKLENFRNGPNAASTPNNPPNLALAIPTTSYRSTPIAAPRATRRPVERYTGALSTMCVLQNQLCDRSFTGSEEEQASDTVQSALSRRASNSVTIPTMATLNATVQSPMPYKNEPSTKITPPRIGLPAASRPDTEYVKYHANPTASFLPFPSGQMFVGADCAVEPPSPPARTRVDPVLPWDHQPAKQNPYEAALIHQPTPTSTQLAARQVMPRDLPVFTGSPEEWPIFYSSYKNSTEVCGYSDAENLARLQRCLRGNALEAVRSRLLLPSSVPYIIDTLRMLFGRPEALINSLLRRVRSCPPPKADNLKSIVDYGLAVQNMIDHMIISEQLNQLNNPMLLNELVDKLPTSLKLQWGAYKQLQADVNLATFNHFVANLVGLASDLMISSESFHGSPKVTANRYEKNKEKLFVHSQQPANDVDETETYPDVNSGHPSKMCIYCEEEAHQIASCQLFKNLTMDARWKVVRQRNLCRTCLVPHRKWPCRSKKECGIRGCQSRHHQLLHGQYTPPTETVPAQASVPSPSREGHQNHHGGMPYTLFRYVPVKLSGNGKSVDIFAFLDEGSSTTMLETEVAEQLGIEGPSASLWLSWTGKISIEEKDSKCICVSIAGQKSTKQYTIENVHTVDELNLPQQSFNYEELCTRYPRMKGLPLESYSAITPRMIIGLEHVRLLTALKTKEGGALGPVAVKTRLGWCAFGKEAEGVNQSGQIHYHNATDPDDSNQSLHDLMRTYFAVEESTVTKGLDSVDDQRALNILRRTTVKLDSNYEAGLIWKVDDPTFPDSLPMAKSRLKGLERRLARDPTLAAKVQEQIESYLRKGYAHKLTSEELSYTDPHRVWYLPLGVVVSPTKPGKIRLIWDAAAKVNGVSLNDLLLKGPDLLVPLVAVILRFRE